MSNRQNHGGGKFNEENRTVVLRNNHILILNHEMSSVANNFCGDIDLLVGRGIHEDVVGTILVEVGHITTVNRRSLDLHARIESAINDLARQDILDLGANESGALTRLDVLELDNLPELAVDHHDGAVLQIICRCHYKILPNRVSLNRGYLTRRNDGIRYLTRRIFASIT